MENIADPLWQGIIDWRTVVTKSGDYTVTVTDSNGCSGTSQAIHIEVTPKPNPVIAGPKSVCINSTSQFSVMPMNGSTYQWIVSNGVITSGANTDAITVQWNSTGNGSVRITQTLGKCSTDTSLNVVIGSVLNPIVTASRTNACEGDSVMWMPAQDMRVINGIMPQTRCGEEA